MFKTRNSFSEKTRQDVVNLLQGRLSDAIDLMLQCKQAHWNVKGPLFIALHELFDDIHDDVRKYVDLLGERIAQFGGMAEGTCQAVVRNTSLPAYPLDIVNDLDHVSALSYSLAEFGKRIGQGIEQAERWSDRGTADILTEISRGVDKNLWFVENHLYQREAARPELKGVA